MKANIFSNKAERWQSFAVVYPAHITYPCSAGLAPEEAGAETLADWEGDDGTFNPAPAGISTFFQSSPSSTIKAIKLPTGTSGVLSGT